MSPPLLLIFQLQLTYSRHCLEALVVSRLVLLGRGSYGHSFGVGRDAWLFPSSPHFFAGRAILAGAGLGDGAPLTTNIRFYSVS